MTNPLPEILPRSRILIILSFVGLFISAYLLYHHIEIRGGYQVGSSLCSWNSTFDCDSIANSKFSELLGLPVAAWGCLYYLLLIGFAAFSRPAPNYSDRDFLSVAAFVTGIGLLSSIAFAAISGLILGKICIFCTSIHVLNVIIFVVLISRYQGARPSVVNGAQTTWTFLRNGAELNSPVRTTALLTLCALLFAFLTLLQVPATLVQQYFEPRERSRASAQAAHAAAEDLKNIRTASINLNLDGTLLDRDFSRGAEQSKTLVTVYSDFQCPHCKVTATVFAKLEKELPIRVIYKDFPLDQSCNSMIQQPFHQFACLASQTARCAGLQGEDKFWAAHDKIFSLETLSEQTPENVAREIALNLNQFNECMTKKLTLPKIERSVEEGKRLKLQGTPSIFINGKPVAKIDERSLEKLVQEEVSTQH